MKNKIKFAHIIKGEGVFAAKLSKIFSWRPNRSKAQKIDNLLLNYSKRTGKRINFATREIAPHTELSAAESAITQLTGQQKSILFLLFLTLVAGLYLNWHLVLVIGVSILTLLYFFDLLFNLFLVYRSYFRLPEITIKRSDIRKAPDADWPVYTILCPLYKEWEVLPQFTAAIKKLSYPKNKLQVMLLLEETDTKTIEKARALNLPNYFEIVVVPDSQPRTKPKACNYGLTKARGEYVVIYDAEDVPEPFQLKKAFLAFGRAGSKVACIQAKLNFYNDEQNILTRLFTLEYSLWFDLVLTGLQSIKAPIPLGGTSNHFRRKDLINFGRWDPFNVTEDADLGMRLVKRKFHTAIINSYTLEEANSQLGNWLKQRSRWVKGYIQTYFVHMRRPSEFLSGWKTPHILTFQLVIGGKVLSMLINPILWIMTLAYFAFPFYTKDFIESLYLAPVFYIAAFCLFAGNFLYMYYYMMGAAKRAQWELLPFAFITPLYWLAMSVAAGIAVWEFIRKPHYWHKTKHGLHLNSKSAFTKVAARLAV